MTGGLEPSVVPPSLPADAVVAKLAGVAGEALPAAAAAAPQSVAAALVVEEEED